MAVRVFEGNAPVILPTLPERSVHAAITSPPYWGLRDYGLPPTAWGGDPSCTHEWGRMERGKRKDILPAEETSLVARVACDERQGAAAINGGRYCSRCDAWLGQLGLEPTPDLYVQHLVEVCREVRRVLRDDGTLWLVLGDRYAAPTKWGGSSGGKNSTSAAGGYPRSRRGKNGFSAHEAAEVGDAPHRQPLPGLKPKDLVGIPWMVAFALRSDGWFLRSDIIWHKPNPMPESVTDRPTKAHEYLFLLSVSERYYYDVEAIKEESVTGDPRRPRGSEGLVGNGKLRESVAREAFRAIVSQRNRRSVWTVATQPYAGAHFATFPPALIEPCVLAATAPQACDACGAAWLRVVADSVFLEGRGSGNKERVIAVGGERSRLNTHIGSSVPWAPSFRPTVGWRPACRCGGLPSWPELAERGDDEADEVYEARCRAVWAERERLLALYASLPTKLCAVLDPFAGAFTTALVADRLGRDSVMIELNPEYIALGRERLSAEAPLFHAEAR